LHNERGSYDRGSNGAHIERRRVGWSVCSRLEYQSPRHCVRPLQRRYGYFTCEVSSRGGIGTTLLVFGAGVFAAVVAGTIGRSLNGTEFAFALVGALVVLLTGAVINVYQFKRRQDLYEEQIRSSSQSFELAVQAAAEASRRPTNTISNSLKRAPLQRPQLRRLKRNWGLAEAQELTLGRRAPTPLQFLEDLERDVGDLPNVPASTTRAMTCSRYSTATDISTRPTGTSSAIQISRRSHAWSLAAAATRRCTSTTRVRVMRFGQTVCSCTRPGMEQCFRLTMRRDWWWTSEVERTPKAMSGVLARFIPRPRANGRPHWFLGFACSTDKVRPPALPGASSGREWVSCRKAAAIKPAVKKGAVFLRRILRGCVGELLRSTQRRTSGDAGSRLVTCTSEIRRHR
jgi:hypothetical protein